MNFPMEYPIFRFFYWLVNTAGVGGLLVTLEAMTVFVVYGLVLRWVASASKKDDREIYLFPPHEK